MTTPRIRTVTMLPALLIHLPTLSPRRAINIMAAIKEMEAAISAVELEATHAAWGNA